MFLDDSKEVSLLWGRTLLTGWNLLQELSSLCNAYKGKSSLGNNLDKLSSPANFMEGDLCQILCIILLGINLLRAFL